MTTPMKVLLINGSPNQHGCTYTALSEVAAQLERRGIATELIWLGAKPVPGCIDCSKCRQLGRCVFDDAVNEVLARADEFGGMVFGSPVYYAGPSGQICAFLDRLFHSGGRKMAGKLGAAVVSCRRAGSSAALDRLQKYFTISNMHVVGSQYWNQVHGYTPEEVRRDEEGLQTMRMLAENMAYLLKCIAAGEAAGVEKPHYEPRIATNFIRQD